MDSTEVKNESITIDFSDHRELIPSQVPASTTNSTVSLKEEILLLDKETDCPEGETPVEWMLLTTEFVADIQTASLILRWYMYRWPVEEYHKIFKSGCQVERYRLAAEGMKTLVGFLSVIAVELLQLTYLHRTQPSAPAIAILNPLELKILKAKSLKPPKLLTVNWAIEAIARLGGYLEHRLHTPIGIQVS
ncbi:hypothetical protein H6H01_36180 [Nostoc calcicola FACHB-3891]|nr:hypothetical protein [Nostoc calcicola FACHB-3891]